MTQSAAPRAMVAQIRFGLGRRGDEPLPADPDRWLLAQLAGTDPGPPGPDSTDCLRALAHDRREKPKPEDSLSRPIARAEQQAAIAWALTTPTPFRERLVWFWSNHFTISLRQGGVGVLAGAYVREAIRPHVTGRFTDMLLAVMRHPGMLIYLDNAQSVGPASQAGARGGRGLNENLARECLELHTLGPLGPAGQPNYNQGDVTSFAAILTGWSVDLNGMVPGYFFRDRAHQPGPKQLLGRTFPEGERGGDAALRFLASHPSTLHHLAVKLARHFVADQPPADAVHRIETVLRETDGNLGAAAGAIVGIEAAWRPLTKLRCPQDFVIAALRAADLPEDKRPPFLPGIMAGLGQPLWNAPLPNGWADEASGWTGPEAMLRRVDWSYSFAGRAASVDPLLLADASLGPLIQPATREAIAHAGSRQEAAALLFASPEFQRR